MVIDGYRTLIYVGSRTVFYQLCYSFFDNFLYNTKLYIFLWCKVISHFCKWVSIATYSCFESTRPTDLLRTALYLGRKISLLNYFPSLLNFKCKSYMSAKSFSKDCIMMVDNSIYMLDGFCCLC